MPREICVESYFPGERAENLCQYQQRAEESAHRFPTPGTAAQSLWGCDIAVAMPKAVIDSLWGSIFKMQVIPRFLYRLGAHHAVKFPTLSLGMKAGLLFSQGGDL